MRDKKEVNEILMEELFSDSNLSSKEQQFVLHYLDSFNATQSYLKVYGGNKATASITACTLLNRPHIQESIKKLKKILSVAYDIDPSRYVKSLLEVAYADIGDYIAFDEEEVPVLDKEGIPIINADTGEPMTRKINKMHLKDSSSVDTKVIQSIKQGKDGITIQLMDKMRALEKLRDFFNWQEQVKEEDNSSNNLIEAINNSVKDTWTDEDVDKDLGLIDNNGKS